MVFMGEILAKKIKTKEMFPIFLRPSVNNNNEPCLELRMQINDINLIKALVSCAYHDMPVIVMPQFRDKLKSLSNLQRIGLVNRRVKQNGETEFYFLV